jgi:hypothetical protein
MPGDSDNRPMPRWVALVGVLLSLTMVIAVCLALAGCKGAVCPPGQHAVPVSGGFQCQRY